jgi:hypothetical protein
MRSAIVARVRDRNPMEIADDLLPLGCNNAHVQIAGRNAAGLLAATRAGIFSSAQQLVESIEQK